MSLTKFVCIHGHFYQPPRENAWLEAIEKQDSAEPFHDWNEKINFECYAPNRAARILNSQGKIIDIKNNYSRINFNFGPTLLSWLEEADPETYEAILDADAKSLKRYGGHGSAIAQVYNHLIMPLANKRDKQTQVIWGIADFEKRFGRKPEGLWLAETAVDIETLEVLADHDIKYTILAPRQAAAIRVRGKKKWHTLAPDSVDSRRAYHFELPSGKSIALFFYHGGISQAVAFQGLLNDGAAFASAFLDVFDNDDQVQLAHIATDGESYGHHHSFGEMALASCLKLIEDTPGVGLTNYGQFLELFPPEYEIQIHENSSWSCVHGVERWRSNCGCCTGGHPDWNQEWRAPLRETLDWVRDELSPIFEEEGAKLLKDPWAARNDYISIILDRREVNLGAFFECHGTRPINRFEKSQMLRLLEMQRHCMLMYTSCGWFFDEVSGIETDQILQYAHRALHYASVVSGAAFQEAFVKRLESIPSNVYINGAESYKRNVLPTHTDLARFGMHYAASSLFEAYPEALEIYSYSARSEVFFRYEAGNQRLALGRVRMQSQVTRAEKHFSFAVLYLGQQNMLGYISLDMDRTAFDEAEKLLVEAFQRSNLSEVISLMPEYFGKVRFTLWDLFQDEKRKILEEIGNRKMREVEVVFREFYRDNYQLMTAAQQDNLPITRAYQAAISFVLNKDLHRFFLNGHLNSRELIRLDREFRKWGVVIEDEPALQLAAEERIFKEIKSLLDKPSEEDLPMFDHLTGLLERLPRMGFKLNVWKSQNYYVFSAKQLMRKEETAIPNAWWEAFLRLGDTLNMQVRHILPAVAATMETAK